MVPKPTSCSPISWSEMYEDGQGIGPTTSACTPTYDRTTNPPSLLGVFCIGYSVPHLMSLDGWQDEWEKIRASNQQCHTAVLTGSQLECLRCVQPHIRAFLSIGLNSLLSCSVDKLTSIYFYVFGNLCPNHDVAKPLKLLQKPTRFNP
jgi:hypothetical protein